jgi:hypothetical protein
VIFELRLHRCTIGMLAPECLKIEVRPLGHARSFAGLPIAGDTNFGGGLDDTALVERREFDRHS